MAQEDLFKKIISHAKEYGFVFPSSDIYDGLSAVYDYGQNGVELKNNIKSLWWKKFVHERDDVVGLDAALIMNPKIWEVSGHFDGRDGGINSGLLYRQFHRQDKECA